MVADVHWQSAGAFEAKDRYALDVSSGVVDGRLDVYSPKVPIAAAAPEVPQVAGKPATGLEILPDGVEARAAARRRVS
ncbi:MAG TPA: hypothetical protein VKT20_08505 [Candidatus Dormibacteraeota bacterium]|nr:hypothetical protein [Candidatus Dormibacteraeota bacterium]